MWEGKGNMKKILQAAFAFFFLVVILFFVWLGGAIVSDAALSGDIRNQTTHLHPTQERARLSASNPPSYSQGEFLLRGTPNANDTNRRPSLPPFPPINKRGVGGSVRSGLAVEFLVREAVTRSITRNRETAEMVGYQFQEIGRIFTQMETNGNFSPVFVETEMSRLHFPPEVTIDPYVHHTKTLIFTLYKLSYEDRTAVEGSPIEWLLQITKHFKTAISSGLKATGRVGLEDTAGVTR